MRYMDTISTFLVLLLMTSVLLSPSIALAVGEEDGTGPFAIPSKPTGTGPHYQGYMDVMIDRPTYVQVRARVYYPALQNGDMATPNTTGAPWATVVFIPGGNGTLNYCNSISSRIASYGFVVVNVELGNMYGQPGLRNPSTMARETTDVVNWIENTTANATHFLFGLMDDDRLAVTGHSWGGAASVLAATDKAYGEPRFDVSFPISATPVANPADYSKDVHMPLGLMTGSVGDNSLKSLFDNGNAPVHYIIVVGADHGGVLAHSAWPVAFFKYWLDNDKDYEHWVYTEGIRDEDDAGTIRYSSHLFDAFGGLSTTVMDEDETVSYEAWVEGITYGNISYEWDLDGDGYWDWQSNVTNTTDMTFTAMGDYAPRLRVKDRYEAHTLDFALHVDNVLPTVVVDQNRTVVEDEEVPFSAVGSSDTPSDVQTLTYKWAFGDGISTEFSPSPLANHTYTTAGTYKATVRVADDDGDETIGMTWTMVLNIPPTAVAMDDVTTTEDSQVDLSGSGNDTPSDLAAGLEYKWDLGDGNSTDWSSTPQTAHTYVTAGNYTATFSVRDMDGNVTNDTLQVTVLNLHPIAVITAPADGEAYVKDREIEFQGYADDTVTDRPWLEYMWDLADGTVIPWGQQLVVTHAYTTSGAYKVVFTARDTDGFESATSITLTIVNNPPTIKKFTPDKDLTLEEDERVAMSVEADDTASDKDNLTVTWTIDGVTVAQGPSVDHVFTEQGEYLVKAVVADTENASVERSFKVTVRNRAPKAQASADRRTADQGQTINFTGSALDTASDLLDMSYEWDFGDGSPTSTDQNVSHLFGTAGTFTVSLTVTDDNGVTDTEGFTVTIYGKPPKRPSGPNDGGGIDPFVLVGVIIAVMIIIGVLVLVLKKAGVIGGGATGGGGGSGPGPGDPDLTLITEPEPSAPYSEAGDTDPNHLEPDDDPIPDDMVSKKDEGVQVDRQKDDSPLGKKG